MKKSPSEVVKIFLEYNADPNATIASIPIWARYLLSAFVVSYIDEHIDKFIRELDIMLSKANFEAPAEGIQSIVQACFISSTAARNLRSPSSSRISQSHCPRGAVFELE